MKSEEQLIVENERLVYYWVRRLTGQADEDMAQEGCIGLWKAARTYQPERGVTFGTYASVCIRSKILHYLRNQRRRNRISLVSLDEPIDSNAVATVSDFISGTEEFAELIHTQMAIREVVKKLPENKKKILGLTYQGVLQQEIGERMGCSQVQISRTLKKIRKEIKESLEL